MIRNYPLLRYGQWAGEPNGQAYIPSRCAYEVFPPRGIHYQCVRPHGTDSLFCKQHEKIVRRRGER